MFDIGFTELLLIGIVGLLVVGPEKLPSVIRTGIQYFRQFKNGVSHIREEVERELALDDIKKDIDDSTSDFSNAIGYDALHESLDELKQETNSLYDIKDWQSNHHVTDAEIEADLSELEEQMGPKLPNADEHADTGIEEVPKTKNNSEQSVKTKANKAKDKSKNSKGKASSDKKSKKKKSKIKPKKKDKQSSDD